MFLTMSWFWRGFQSAIFYYVSCAPCSKLSYRRKGRQEFKRTKANRALHEAEQGQYAHPSPFDTNPYWKEDIALGPGPPQRRAARDGKTRPAMGRGLRTRGIGSSTDTGTSSSDTMVADGSSEGIETHVDGWNKRRYQRTDEVLWGRQSEDGKTAGLSPISRTASGNANYYQARNPAVNDLHPPVVSTQPTHPSEIQWMLQPPPRAKMMAGKERGNTPPNRSRSGSGTSNGSRGSGKRADTSLGRRVGERLMESKIKRGEQALPTPKSIGMSRETSERSNISATNIAQRRPDQSFTSERSFESFKHKAPQARFSISTESGLPSSPPNRPPLSTIPSTSLLRKPKDESQHLRPLLLTANSASSLQILQELVAPSSQLNTIKGTSSPLPDAAVKAKLPPVSHQEDVDLGLPQVESWFPDNGWALPLTAAKRPRERWSMDF